MIANDEQLQLVREQVATLESALESLSRSVRPRSEQQFKIFAEGYVDQLEILRAAIDEYLGIASVRNPEPEIEVSIEGPNAALGDTRVSAVTKLVDRFRRALRTTVGAIRDSLAVVDRENVTEEFLDRLCDPPLQGVAAGSVKIQLGAPHAAIGSDLYAQGLKLLSLAIRSVGDDSDAARELLSLPSEQRKAALTATKILAPGKNDLSDQVGLAGHFLGPGRHVQLTPATRKRVLQQLRRISRQAELKTAIGTIREVDLDRRLFSLRAADIGLTIQRCKYNKSLDAQVLQLVNKQVEVKGTLRTNGARATRLRVRTIAELPADLFKGF